MASEVRDESNRRWDEPFGKEPLDGFTVDRILAVPAFADIRPEDFPKRLALYDIIANDGRLREFRRGEVIIRKGDYGSSLFVILEGEVIGLASGAADDRILHGGQKSSKSWWRSIVQLMTPAKPPEYRPPRLRVVKDREALQDEQLEGLGTVDIDDIVANNQTFRLYAPQVFGELAALTRTPRGASIFAATDTLCFELRWQGLRDIRNWSPNFKLRIDALYRERGLVSRLRECPIMQHVDKEAFDEIARNSLFETYGTTDWTHRFKRAIGEQENTGHIIEQEQVICEQGNHVDGLLLINSGFARVTERIDHGERTIGQLSINDVFALNEVIDIIEGKPDVALKTGLRAIGYVDVIRIPTSMVRQHILPGLPEKYRQERALTRSSGSEELRQGMVDFVVDHRFINGEKAMVINLDRCIGCDDCVRACATAHHNNPRFTRQGHTYANAMVVNACMHCTDPVCLIGCPTGAIHRHEGSGSVVIDDGICIGCATCANSCPYNNIKMVDIRDENGDYVLNKDGHTIARATKCDLCFDQLTGPACVQACPHDALTRINIRDTKKLTSWLG